MKKLFAFLFLAALTTASIAENIDYGAGEMKNPRRTMYVSTSGNDRNDGKTSATAWRTIRHGVKELRAGDTLLIGGGEYIESQIQLNVKDQTVGFDEQCGKPGSPIRIMGQPGEKVVLRGSYFLPKAQNDGTIYEFNLKKKPYHETVQEVPSQIELQPVHGIELVREYPGTFYYEESGRLLVHFAAKDQTGVNVAQERIGLRIHGSYIHVENLIFENFYEGIYIRMNVPYDKNAAEHITIKNCGFYYNYKNGLVADGASKSLFIGNRGAANTERGSFLTMRRAHDNLFTGNWLGPNPQTLRQRKPYEYNFAMNNYGIPGGARNHVIGNVLDDKHSFRWKAGCPESRFEDNIVTGRFYAESKPIPAVIRNNFFGDKIAWQTIGGDLWKKEFTGTPMVFENNVRDRKDFKPENPIVFEAEKLTITLPKSEFPQAEFQNLRAEYIENDSAAILWETPDNDGVGSVKYWIKGEKPQKRGESRQQGTRHAIGLTGLKPDTEYEYFAIFAGRRGEWRRSSAGSFRTAAQMREPKILEVGPGKMTLAEASCAAIPGDTVKLAPGRHIGQFTPLRGGITLIGQGAVIDGLNFYAPLIEFSGQSDIVIDGITFVNPEKTARVGVIVMENTRNIIIRNCRAGDKEAISWLSGPFIRSRKSDNLLIENNISWGCDYPLLINGNNIKIRNNTIVDATMWSTNFWSVSDLEITNNIFYRPCVDNKRSGALLLNDIKGSVVSDGNVFWSPNKEHAVGGTIRDIKSKVLKASKTLEEWQNLTGLDKNSIHADPQFVNYEKGDFALKPESPAKGKGADVK